MSNLRRVFAFWVAVVVFLPVVRRAEAQTAISITIPPTGVQRARQDGAGTVPNTQINLRDCLNEDVIHFTLNLGGGASNYALEVWAGEACEMSNNRIGPTPKCWPVTPGGTPNNVVFPVDVPIRELLSGRTGGKSIGGVTGTGGSGGTDTTAGGGGTDTTGGTGGSDAVATAGDANNGGTGGNAGTASVDGDVPSACIPTSAVTSPQTLVLTFLLLDAAKSTSFGSFNWKATYKLNAPAPPSGVSSGIGESIAPIKWTPVTMSADQTINGYQFYCDPAPGKAGAVAANVLPSQGDPLPGSCADSLVLIAGHRPDDSYKCGTADKTASRGNATNLLNNVAYNVAVAATDTYRNVGVISAPACAIPQPVTGFFEAYRLSGGEGGGGFCSFSRRQQPLILVSLLGIASCLVVRRRRAA